LYILFLLSLLRNRMLKLKPFDLFLLGLPHY
jgi:hypothetical protein